MTPCSLLRQCEGLEYIGPCHNRRAGDASLKQESASYSCMLTKGNNDPQADKAVECETLLSTLNAFFIKKAH